MAQNVDGSLTTLWLLFLNDSDDVVDGPLDRYRNDVVVVDMDHDEGDEDVIMKKA